MLVRPAWKFLRITARYLASLALLVGPALLIASSCQCADDLSIAHPASRTESPWPFWQKTASRIGRTHTLGPQVPVLAWKVRIDPSDIYEMLNSSCVMGADGRLFVGHEVGLACVDSATGGVLWQFPTAAYISKTPAIWQGRVLFGAVDDNFYCVDAEEGTFCWSIPAAPHPHSSPVVDDEGNVYFGTYEGIVYARRVEDGSEVWTTDIGSDTYSSPALDGNGRLFLGQWGQWVALRTSTGDVLWRFQMDRGAFGSSPVENGRVYVGSRDYNLYCIDAQTGDEIWRFEGDRISGNCVALGHHGTVYHVTGATGWLHALDADGKEKWRFPLDDGIKNPPIVDGIGTIYMCTFRAPDSSHIYAVNPDGTPLWVYEMPDYVSASPMLGPDGTLYVVCKDKYLYAFRDWQEAVPGEFRAAPDDNLDWFPKRGGLDASDDDYVVVQSTSPFLSNRPTAIETWATLNSSSLGRLDVTVEGHTSAPSYQQIELFNFWANRWEVIDLGPCRVKDETITIGDIPNPSAYVSPQDKRIGLRITNWPTGFALRPLPFTAYLDHIEFSVKFR